MSQLPPGFVLDGPSPTAPVATPGPLMGPPPKPEKPDQPKTTYRPMTAEEVAARGLQPGSYQISSEGKIDPVGTVTKANPGEGYEIGPDGVAKPIPGGKADMQAAARRNALAVMTAAGIDPSTGYDPVSDLIKGSTSGRLQAIGAEAYGGFTGDATSGMENIGKLKTIASDLTLQLTGGSLGSQISNSDRDFIVERIGNIADPYTPADQRLAAWEQVKKRLINQTRPDDVPEGNVFLGYGQRDDGTFYQVWGKPGSQPPAGTTPGGSPPNGGPTPTPSPDGSGGSFINTALEGIGQGTSDLIKGAASLPGLVINPINRVIGDALGYDGSKADLGNAITRTIGLPDNNNPMTSAINRGGAAALTGGLTARALSGLVSPGVTQGVLSTLGRTPIADTAAGAAAGGAGEAARASGVGPVGQTVATLAGGLGGNMAANGLARLAMPKTASPLLAAADRQNVDLLPADAGGPVSRIVTSATKASPISATPVMKAAQNSVEQMSNAARRVANDAGSVVNSDTAGEAVQSAARRYADRTRDIGRTLYENAYKETGPLKIPAPRAVAAINQQIAKLQEAPNTNAGAIAELSKLRDDLSGGMTVMGMHDLRSTISGGIFDGKLRSPAEAARYKEVRAALSDDMFETLKGYGLTSAANKIKRADTYWSQRVEHIDQVLQPIIGKEGQKGGEQVVATLEQMARGKAGGNQRLSRLLANMTQEEAGNVRAAIIDRIGKATPGQQTADGEAFSPARFLTNWNQMTPQAKATLFKNKAQRQNLDDIAFLAERMKATQAMANHSNTGLAVMGNVGAQGALAVTNFPAFVLGSGAQFLTGKLMASPAFARMLAKVPATPDQGRKWVEQLGVLAGREPALAGDLGKLQQGLSSLLSQSPKGVIAQPESDQQRR